MSNSPRVLITDDNGKSCMSKESQGIILGTNGLR